MFRIILAVPPICACVLCDGARNGIRKNMGQRVKRASVRRAAARLSLALRRRTLQRVRKTIGERLYLSRIISALESRKDGEKSQAGAAANARVEAEESEGSEEWIDEEAAWADVSITEMKSARFLLNIYCRVRAVRSKSL